MTDSDIDDRNKNSPLTAGQLMNIAWEQYQDFYDDPRPIHYFDIRQIVAHDNIRALDYVAEAIDLGCVDGNQKDEPRSREALFENIGKPWDDRWELSEDVEDGE